MRSVVLTLAVIASCAPAAFAASPPPEQFVIDPVHTRVMVAVQHAGFSRALGTVSGSTGRVDFVPGWAGSQVDVRIPVRRLDFGDASWNTAVQRLLDTARYPEAHFVSTKVTARDATHADACGDLTLHGATHPACLDITFNALKRHPMPPFRRTVGFSAVAHLDRTAFGIEQWRTVIGSDVELRIELEATRGVRAPTAGQAPDTADTTDAQAAGAPAP